MINNEQPSSIETMDELKVAAYKVMVEFGVATTTTNIGGSWGDLTSPNLEFFNQLLKEHEQLTSTELDKLSFEFDNKSTGSTEDNRFVKFASSEKVKLLEDEIKSNLSEKTIKEYKTLQGENLKLQKESNLLLENKQAKEEELKAIDKEVLMLAEERAKALNELAEKDETGVTDPQLTGKIAGIKEQLRQKDIKKQELTPEIAEIEEQIKDLQQKSVSNSEAQRDLLSKITISKDIKQKVEQELEEQKQKELETQKQKELQEKLKAIQENFKSFKTDNPGADTIIFCVTKAYNNSLQTTEQKFEKFFDSFSENFNALNQGTKVEMPSKDSQEYKQLEEYYAKMAKHFGEKEITPQDLDKAIEKSGFLERMIRFIMRLFNPEHNYVIRKEAKDSLNDFSQKTIGKTFVERLKEKKNQTQNVGVPVA
jgi:hypothetical protein